MNRNGGGNQKTTRTVDQLVVVLEVLPAFQPLSFLAQHHFTGISVVDSFVYEDMFEVSVKKLRTDYVCYIWLCIGKK